MHIRHSVVLGLLGIAMLSACTTQSPGDPRPTGSTGATTSSTADSGETELPFAGAPEVNDPLDTSRYEQDPCRSLTSEQAESLNLPPTGTLNDQVTLGIGCDWFDSESRGEASINFIVDDPRGLSAEYDANSKSKWAYFDVLGDIEGYPAVARDGTDRRDTGLCIVVVGVANDLTFESIVQLSRANIENNNSCELASDVAGLALQTMKAGG